MVDSTFVVNNNQSIIPLYSFIYNIISLPLGILFGTYISFLYQKRAIRISEFISATKEFRAAFAEAYDYVVMPFNDIMLADNKLQIHNFIENWMRKHRIAIMNFWFYVKKSKRDRFKKAYQEYCYPNYSENLDLPLRDYDCRGSDKPIIEAEKEIRQKLLEKIEKLIKFADI